MAADCDDDEAPAVAPTCHFALRIVDIDLAHSKPNAELDPIVSPLTHRELRQVPLVRVFGGTPRGQKACVHFHGFFRSFYVPFDGERSDEVSLRELANELEDQLRQSGDGQQQHLGANQALVYNLSVVSRTPFYGYHEEPRPFLHVQMVRPGDVEPAARLFMRGFCQRRPRQPHEAHVPHLLQFKVDYNLLGMDFVRLERVRWRGTLPVDSRALELPPPPPPPPPPPNAAAASGSAPSSSAAANVRDARHNARNAQLPSSAAGLPSGGAPSSSPAASQPGYRCVWTRGRTHGLNLQVRATDDC